MFEPVKIGFGGYMTGFYNALVPTTRGMHEYIARGIGKSIVWAPARMIDSAEEMLAAWVRNDTDSAPTQPPKLPVMIVAVADDYTPTARDFTRQIAESNPVRIAGDVKERVFGLRTIAGDIRAQVVIFADDEPTAHSLASQFALYLDAKRRFPSKHTFAGIEKNWPVVIESPDLPAVNVKTEIKNIKILAVDLTLKATIPLFDAPKDGDQNDGLGVPGTNDPAGYPVLAVAANIIEEEPKL